MSGCRKDCQNLLTIKKKSPAKNRLCCRVLQVKIDIVWKYYVIDNLVTSKHFALSVLLHICNIIDDGASFNPMNYERILKIMNFLKC